ncbi:unnamed protein product [Caenorhabditis brenneri]
MAQNDYESSGYSTSASSDFGSLDERFKFPPAGIKNATKRRAVEKMEDLDEMMKESLVLSPEKRVRLSSASPARVMRIDDERDLQKNGRPPTRRSTSRDMQRSPRIRELRAAVSTGSALNALCTDSISPKLIGQYHGTGISPKRRCNLAESGSIYSKHRLGVAFSPLVAGARKKLATPQGARGGLNSRQSPMNSPRQGGLRSRGTPRILLSDRLKMLD